MELEREKARALQASKGLSEPFQQGGGVRRHRGVRLGQGPTGLSDRLGFPDAPLGPVPSYFMSVG